jgi:hypothetical protein
MKPFYKNNRIDYKKIEDVKTAITASFKQVKKEHGFTFTRQNFMCCQSCACAAIPSDTKKYVFYHQQDNGSFQEGYSLILRYGTSLDYGDKHEEKVKELANELVNTLKANGLVVDWDGDIHTAIEVTDWVKPITVEETVQAERDQAMSMC